MTCASVGSSESHGSGVAHNGIELATMLWQLGLHIHEMTASCGSDFRVVPFHFFRGLTLVQNGGQFSGSFLCFYGKYIFSKHH